ncbi:MAG TPA: AarF/UbiB family protein, partial [Polyangiaceae bacterium]|nr:AarF/UbiB family protein [Polyangiaceae bacterium]
MQLGRVAEISKVFLEEGLGLSDSKDASESAGTAGSEEQRARRLRRALERLGPTFVKFGQMLATRVDLFGPEFLRELGKLRSHVPPFSASEARASVERELGRPIEEVFVDFPEQPMASASIAQVYRAQLRESGAWVAVKVQRPRLQETLSSDLAVLIEVSRFVDRLVPAYHRSLVHKVAVEYAARARQEIDFLAEATAMARFQDVLETLPEFRVPSVRLDLCSERLLVMEWLDGPLLDEVESPARLREIGFEPRF